MEAAHGMSVEANKAVIRQHFAHTDKLAAQDGDPGFPTMEPFFQQTLAAFGDDDATIHELVAEGDWVVARLTQSGTHQCEWMGIAATGKRVAWEVIVMVQIVDGDVVQVHSQADIVGLLRQLTAPPDTITPSD